ncbi:MauE/DoxX family redox-associated membrane protein [Kineococcus sp. SYSU DK004]|uniref:MauE/DoxX family redox-associated membrane protein n=1 Tax=Kineococcus sp. SYSU DK004 TaxID=3383125 RepID=UPI003D7EAB7C
MNPLTVPLLVGAALLVVAGVAKVRRPRSTAQALRTQSLPSGTALVRLLGAAELLVVALALSGSPAGAWALAAAYAGFTAFVVLALVRRRPLSSCGCFGAADVPPTAAHVAVTGALAAVGAAVALTGGAGLGAVLAAGPGPALAVAVSAAVGTGLSLLVLTALPRLRAAAPSRRSAATSTPTTAPGAPASGDRTLLPLRSAP